MKKGVSDVIATVLIILLVLAAIILVWNFVKGMITESAGNLDASQFSVSLSTQMTDLSGVASIPVIRNPGQGDIYAIKIVFKNSSGSTFDYVNNTRVPDELETVYYVIDLTGKNIVSFEVYPIFLINNKEKIGIKTDFVKNKSVSHLPANISLSLLDYLVGWWNGDYTTITGAGQDFFGNVWDAYLFTDMSGKGNHGYGAWIRGYGYGRSGLEMDFLTVPEVTGDDHLSTQQGVTLTSGKVYCNGLQNAWNFNGESYTRIFSDSFSRMNSVPFTISIWIKPNSWDNSYGGRNTILSMGDTNNGFSLGWGQNNNLPGGFTGYGFSIANGGIIRSTAANIPLTGTWTHVVAVYDGSNIQMYLNGIPSGSAVSSSSPGSVTSMNMIIGASNISGNIVNFFNGDMDELGIYDYAMSQGDVTYLYNYGAGICSKPTDVNKTDATRFVVDHMDDVHKSVLTYNHNYIQINNSASLDLTGQFTIMAWINPSSYDYNGEPVIYSRGDIELTGYGSLKIRGTSAGDSGYAPLGNWTHIAGVYDRTNMIVYRNGIQSGSPVSVSPPAHYVGNATIGIGNTLVRDYFYGRVDDLMIFNRSLTQAEIQSIMNG
jgi:hypothetical protein